MKLYYYPGACSMAVHIVLREAGYDFELDRVDLAAKKTASGEDYNQINPKGYVPALRMGNGEVLTEVAVILQYLADHKPTSELAPLLGGLDRYRVMEWLNFTSSEIHKTLGALFNPKITPEWKADRLTLFGRRAEWVDGQLAGKDYLMGTQFSIADAYLFTVLNWCHLFHVDLSTWPRISAYMARVAARPAVQATLQAEGLGS